MCIINSEYVSYKYPGSGQGAFRGPIGSNFVRIIEKVFAIEHIGNVNKANLKRNQGKLNKFKFYFSKNSNLKLFTSFISHKSHLFKVNDENIYKYLIVLGLKVKFGNNKSKFKWDWLDARESTNRIGQIGLEYLKHKLIGLILLMGGGVHPNPGPWDNDSNSNTKTNTRPDLSFLTYNCRGLNDVTKLRRILVKLNELVNKNYIIALQETHKINVRTLETYWKNQYIANCTSTNKKGVVLLFNNSYKVNQVFKDMDDRAIIAELENESSKIIVGNVYYPNDHKEAINFSEIIYGKIMEFQYRTVEAYTCLMGDMNQCFSSEDSVNRVGSKSEIELAKITRANNETCGLIDSYRILEKSGGFTWRRGNCYSRLDYILVSEELREKIVKVGLDWCVEKSDHAAVICNLKVVNNIKKGLGTVRLNAEILKNPETAREVEKQLKEFLDQTPEEWNPHTKLEYMKVGIRSVFANVSGVINKDRNESIKDIEEQINRINSVREKESVKSVPNVDLLTKIDEANVELNTELDRMRARYSEDLAFKSGVRWYEEGEKSNKYFLGLTKLKSRQKLISEISNGGQIYRNQNSIINCIRSFYEELYRKKEKNDCDVSKDFFKLCPKLSEQSKAEIDKE